MLVQLRLVLRHPPFQRRLRRILEGVDAVVSADAGEGDPSSAALADGCDVVVLREELLAGPIEDLAARLAATPDHPEIVVVTRSESASHRTDLIGRGARVVIGEKDDADVIRRAIDEVIAQRAAQMLLLLRARQADRYGSLADFVEESPTMQRFVHTVRKILDSDTTILVSGETGVGKERLAHVIHNEGPRAGGPFVALNCAAIPETLLESELFGHEKGAFTNADRERRGKFELAHGGTLFLDEIAEMPLHLQAKLLRVLQEREIERIGGETSMPVDIRVIAATNRDLGELVKSEQFRSDLYYRIAVVTLSIPALRERSEDVSRLAERFLASFCAKLGKPALTLSPAARQAMVSYAWPGNVRELMNVIERAVLLAEGSVIDLADLPESIAEGQIPVPTQPLPEGHDLQTSNALASMGFETELLLTLPWARARALVVARLERWYIERTLDRCRGKIGETAAALGMSPRSLYSKMRHHGLDKRAFRDL